LVSKLHTSELSENFLVHYSEIIIKGLVHHDVVDFSVYVLAYVPESVNSIDVNVFKQQLNLGVQVLQLSDEHPEKLYHEGVVVEDAKVQAVEERQLVGLEVVRVRVDQLDHVVV